MASTVEVTDATFGRLRLYNVVMGLLHAVQGIVVVVLATDFTLPVTAAFLEGPPGTPAGFVYGIFFSLFVFFNIFALTQWLQYRQVGRFRNYLAGERMYILLSLLAKSALAWQVFAGTLVPPA